jgi:hypothetical protein
LVCFSGRSFSSRSIPRSVIGCREHSILAGPHEISHKRHATGLSNSWNNLLCSSEAVAPKLPQPQSTKLQRICTLPREASSTKCQPPSNPTKPEDAVCNSDPSERYPTCVSLHRHKGQAAYGQRSHGHPRKQAPTPLGRGRQSKHVSLNTVRPIRQ